MKKIKKISYPNKYEELIKKYGEEEGNKLYYKFIRGTSIEKYILKYGEEEGILKYEELKKIQKNAGVSLDKMILKYGEKEGNIKYKKWKDNTRQDLSSFIRRYGEEEGNIKYNEFKRKSLIPLSKLDRTKVPNPRRLDYWIDKLNGDLDKAKIELSKYQNKSTLDTYIKRHGEEEGKKKYIEDCLKKVNNLENFIKKYGLVDGTERYNNYILKLKEIRSKDYLINKYGKEYYKNLIIKKTNYLKNQYSDIGLEFCEKINEQIKNKFNKIYYGENEYKFYVWLDEFKLISPDMYIKDINLVIEFYGDYWHRNPKIYENINDDFKLKIWEHDEKRINVLKTKYNCEVIIIWESDYLTNKNNIINYIIEKINK